MARSRMSLRGRPGLRPVVTAAVASACACAALAAFPKEARADIGHFDLGLDGSANALLAPNPTQYNLSTLGAGFRVRAGDQFHLQYQIKLTPEVGYAYNHIFAKNAYGEDNIQRVFAGARLGFGRWVIPTVYAHVGYGFQSVSLPNAPLANASTIPNSNGFTFDVGAAVEFKLARHLMIGPHFDYDMIAVTNGPQWISFGGHADILF